MTVIEIGCMGVKPGIDILNETTKEGQVLPKAWEAIMAAPGGPNWISWGLEAEDPTRVWAFFEWNSIEDHEEFAKSFGGEAVKDFPTILTHGIFTKHVVVTDSLAQALKSPLTEVLLAFFTSDISPAEKNAATSQIQRFVEKAFDKCSDVTAVSYGWGVENDFPVLGGEEGKLGSLLTVFVGWPSHDANMQFAQTEAFKENIGLIGGMEGMIKSVLLHINCRNFGRRHGSNVTFTTTTIL